MSFRLVPKSVTLNDLERRNGRYIALFHWIGKPALQKTICGGIYAKVYCILVRVQYRRKESSCSLSQLLMSFLFVIALADTRGRAIRPGPHHGFRNEPVPSQAAEWIVKCRWIMVLGRQGNSSSFRHSKRCKFMPKMHQNTFGDLAPLGPAGVER